MAEAWPRFLPGSGPEAVAHALIIEAYAILVEQLGEGQRDLIRAHELAMSFAQSRYTTDEVRTACNACATAPGNSNILVHWLISFFAEPSATVVSGQVAQFVQRGQLARLLPPVRRVARPLPATSQLDAA